MLCIRFIGCNIGFYGKNCTKCSDNCLNDTCQFQIGHGFDCKDVFKGELCKEGEKLLVSQMKAKIISFQVCLYVSLKLSS